MTVEAIIFMSISCAIIWGGLTLSIITAYRDAK